MVYKFKQKNTLSFIFRAMKASHS